jgi:hypothetical protein
MLSSSITLTTFLVMAVRAQPVDNQDSFNYCHYTEDQTLTNRTDKANRHTRAKLQIPRQHAVD